MLGKAPNEICQDTLADAPNMMGKGETYTDYLAAVEILHKLIGVRFLWLGNSMCKISSPLKRDIY